MQPLYFDVVGHRMALAEPTATARSSAAIALRDMGDTEKSGVLVSAIHRAYWRLIELLESMVACFSHGGAPSCAREMKRTQVRYEIQNRGVAGTWRAAHTMSYWFNVTMRLPIEPPGATFSRVRFCWTRDECGRG